MIGKVIDTYWESTIINGKSFLLNDSERKSKKAKFCINVFYFIVFCLSIKTFSPYGQFPKWYVLIESERFFTPKWSVFWITYFDWEITVKTILLSFFICSFLAMILWRRYRLIRFLLFLSMFFYLSLIFSFLNAESWMYLMTISAFLLIFIPNSKDKHHNQIGLLQLFFGIQTFLLNIYFVSGSLKFYGLIRQEIDGRMSALSSMSLSEYSAMNAYHHNMEYFFTSFLLNSSSFIFSAFLISGFCIEFFSIYIIFNPRYHRIWGLLLILLHGFIVMFIGPDFTIQALTVGVFIFFSPFCNTSDIFEDLNELFKTIKSFLSKPDSGNSITIFYPSDCKVCGRLLNFISKDDRLRHVSISSKDSDLFRSLVLIYKDISSIDSIVVLEKHESAARRPRIFLKGNAVTWILAKIGVKFKILRFFYLLIPFLGNLGYDLITSNVEKTNMENV